MPAQGLSCYTANLHGYMAGEWDADAIMGRSVRLAVRVGLPGGLLAFSHHEPSLDRLPDGSRLCYTAASSAAAALPELAGELARHGRVLIVVDSARLPWSVAQGGQATPHWLLVDGGAGDEWHVVDSFTALLPTGEQPPHSGWLSSAQLCDAMKLPERWEPEQELRNALAFGSPVPVPPGEALWLRRCRQIPLASTGMPGRWLCGDAAVLPLLISHLETGSTRHLDDVWAAAGHRCFAYRWRLNVELPGKELPGMEAPGMEAPGMEAPGMDALRAALSGWENLPRLIRFAVESAQRGRPRAALIRSTLAALLRAEEDLS